MNARMLRVEHETVYRYAARVDLAYHLAYLRPLRNDDQQVDSFTLDIDPAPSHVATARDVFGNERDTFTLVGPHETLRVHAASRVNVRARFDALDPASSPPWEAVSDALRFRAGAPFEPAVQFCFASPFVPRLAQLREYARVSFPPGRPLLAAALDLMHRIHAEFTYDAESTDVSTPLALAFGQRRGVCQDFAHVAIGALRALGLPAAYASGYLLSRPPPGQERLIGADASHAWVRAWCPVNGWVDLDPTNDCVVGDGHVTLAVGRDYGDVTPVRGVIRGGGNHTLAVAVSVLPVGPA
jgi:transglutaminase-like putative cysteine protease